jgi:hypothetical protein
MVKPAAQPKSSETDEAYGAGIKALNLDRRLRLRLPATLD